MLEYKNILVYKSYEGEENPIDVSNFKETEVYVSHNFQARTSPYEIWGEAKVYVGETNALLADIIIYNPEIIFKGDQPAEDKMVSRLFSKEQIELLVPCIAVKIIKRENSKIVDFKLTEIGLCLYNANKEIKSLKKQSQR